MKKLIRNDAEEKKCVTGYPQEDVGYAKWPGSPSFTKKTLTKEGDDSIVSLS